MKPFIFAAPAATALTAAPAAAQVVDGQNTGGNEYAGGSTETILTNPAAPTSNFDAPTNTATVGYTINLLDSGGSLYGLVSQSAGSPAAVGAFANLYFDLNPTFGDGSDLGFELGGSGATATATAFIPGRNGAAGFSTPISSSLFNIFSTTVNGLTNLEFRLDNSLFTSFIAGLNYYGPGDGFSDGDTYAQQTFESTQTLRLSQSLSYSVAGGALTGTDRLGSFSVAATTGSVPEPATWGMMLLGFGVMGVSLRRRKRTNALMQVA